ncbi:hypothetical protein QR680_000092 [Steinernema hermaphroditum]|uniref:Uncharacterized protein n=1 Tax=Steinernema hermaphroditum TaxID=289476 RepID=A0AA39GTB9_9BILA|nr:hypothetical protein QR680_000092 [Steinernema hermaphroditum]
MDLLLVLLVATSVSVTRVLGQQPIYYQQPQVYYPQVQYPVLAQPQLFYTQQPQQQYPVQYAPQAHSPSTINNRINNIGAICHGRSASFSSCYRIVNDACADASSIGIR